MDLGLANSSLTSSTNEYDVYLGLWTNWSRGRILGSTLTVSRQNGDLLIAFIAFFVSFVLTQLWRICCVILHHRYSTDSPRDALHHQRQVIFRNAASPDTGLVSFVQVLWAWMGKSSKARLLQVFFVPVFVATTCVTGSVLSSGFSSRVSTGVGDEVLLSGDMCGWISGARNLTRQAQQSYLLPWLAAQTMEATNYAKECYSSSPSGVLACSTFVRSNLLRHATFDTGYPCPFDGGICVKDRANLRIDSGYIDSSEDLGINLAPDQRFSLRWLIQCAPLKTENYTSTYNVSEDRSYSRYHYGNSFDPELDFVYQASNDAVYESQLDVNNVPRSQGDYGLGTAYTTVKNGSIILDYHSSMMPIAELNKTDADLSIIFLSARDIHYLEPNGDDWYRATRFYSNEDGNVSMWMQNGAASPLACLQQMQICNASLDGQACTPLGGKLDLYNNALPLFAATTPQRSLVWIERTVGHIVEDLAGVPDKLGSMSLASRNFIQASTMPALPKTQWQQDVALWFSIILASLQQTFVTFADGPSHHNPDIQQWVVEPAFEAEHDICHSQKIRSGRHASFSVCGLAVIAGIGGLVILISIALSPILFYLGLHQKKSYAVLEWCANETLQLQRLAYEEASSATWSEITDAVPTISADKGLVVSDAKIAGHPHFKAYLGFRNKLAITATEISLDRAAQKVEVATKT